MLSQIGLLFLRSGQAVNFARPESKFLVPCAPIPSFLLTMQRYDIFPYRWRTLAHIGIFFKYLCKDCRIAVLLPSEAVVVSWTRCPVCPALAAAVLHSVKTFFWILQLLRPTPICTQLDTCLKMKFKRVNYVFFVRWAFTEMPILSRCKDTKNNPSVQENVHIFSLNGRAYRHTAIPFHIFVHHNLLYDIIYYYIYYNIYNNI